MSASTTTRRWPTSRAWAATCGRAGYLAVEGNARLSTLGFSVARVGGHVLVRNNSGPITSLAGLGGAYVEGYGAIWGNRIRSLSGLSGMTIANRPYLEIANNSGFSNEYAEGATGGVVFVGGRTPASVRVRGNESN
jgi:hypothetical protein